MNIDELLAIEEIKQLRQSYSAYFDSHDLDNLTELFCADATCEFPEDFGGDWSGKETIRTNFAGMLPAVGEEFDTLHIVSNPWITVTGKDTARGRWYLTDMLTRQKAGTAQMTTLGGHDNPLMFLGLYEDEYRRVDGLWRFARMRLSLLWPDRSYSGLAYA